MNQRTAPSDSHPVAPDPSRAERRSWLSFVGSLAMHAMLLLFLFWLLPGRAGGGSDDRLRRGQVVLARLDEQTDEVLYEDQSSLDEASSSAPSPLPIDAQPPDVAPPEMPREAKESAPDLPGWLMADAASMATPLGQQGGALVAELSEADLEAIRQEQQRLAAQGPTGPAASLSLFGSRPMTGQRFVFVLDRSKSMGAQGLGVLGHARSELGRALSGLEPRHYFQIVAFHHQTVLMDRRAMLPATREHVNQVPQFIDQLAPFGGTNYEGALYTALALTPDVVVVFTDGDEPGLNAGQVAAIVRACRGTTTIHCLQFGWEPAEPKRNFLHDLAERSGGSYRYICAPEWAKRD